MNRRTLFIADEIWGRLVDLGKKRGMKVSELIRQAIYEFLQREGG